MSAKVIDAKDFMDCVIDRVASSSDNGSPVVVMECRYRGVYYIAAAPDEHQARVSLVQQIADALGAVVVNLHTAADYIGVNQKAAKVRYLAKLRRRAEKSVVDALLYARGVDTVALMDVRIAAQVSDLVSRLHGLVDAQSNENDLRADIYARLVEDHAHRLRDEVDAYRDRWDSIMRGNGEDSQAVSPVQGEMPL